MTKYFLLATSLLLLSCNGEADTQSEAQETRELSYTATVSFIEQPDEEIISVRAAVADDDDSRSAGLMNVYNLPEDAGMLFIFDDEAPRSFWMANTPISLDILFVNSEMEIVRIHRNTPPYSHENIVSESPAKYVVEVNAGFTLNHDIREGMKIDFTTQ
ncbi:DUF192 domain-containing protein [Rhodohalobacter sp.]|uniref:DUF192 domain-containing protein n=1 Tax=Rhodohalobacter sp. TaxID=1974210 RepID=UPI002ACE72BD|nr:DUF192 domain-containing protein [Rhodohalobacter sp.]MDZ7757488.1 DUF192 domain-containing protein [Rhodohalobacter sp.]